jgi:kumamolisin
VNGGHNHPTGDPGGPDGEVMLDIEVAGGVALGAHLVVYFAPNNDQGFIDAITKAVNDTTYKPSIMSISWGQAEAGWTAQSMQAMDAAFQSAAAVGMTIFVAAGDNSADDNAGDGLAHVDYPASSPYVIGCGGTNLVGSGTTITSDINFAWAVNKCVGQALNSWGSTQKQSTTSHADSV